MQFRRRQLTQIIVVAAVLMAVAVPLAFAIAPRAIADDQPKATASVVKVENRKAPGTKGGRHRFRPGAPPPPGRGGKITRNGARRWGISAASLNRRVACESRYHWWASN